MGSAGASGIRILDEPVPDRDRATYVRGMFDAIAPRYDLLNTILSAGIDRRWRRFAARCTGLVAGESALDVCSGTGEFGTELRLLVRSQGLVVSMDFSYGMLSAGSRQYGLNRSSRAQADAVHLPLLPNSFHAATMAFGVRNIASPEHAVREIFRVLKPGGRFVCLEFADPLVPAFKTLYNAYSRIVLSGVGRIVSGHAEAYSYLPESVKRWKTRSEMEALLKDAGFRDVCRRDLMFGVACVHVGRKPFAVS